MGARLKFWRRSPVLRKGSRDEAVEIYIYRGISRGFVARDGSAVKSLLACARLSESIVVKTSKAKIRQARPSPAPARFSHFLLLNDFPPPSRSLEQAKSHSTILQWLRRQISLDYCTIPPATRAKFSTN